MNKKRSQHPDRSALRKFTTEAVERVESMFKELFGRNGAFVLIIHDNDSECLTAASNIVDEQAITLIAEANKLLTNAVSPKKH